MALESASTMAIAMALQTLSLAQALAVAQKFTSSMAETIMFLDLSKPMINPSPAGLVLQPSTSTMM